MSDLYALRSTSMTNAEYLDARASDKELTSHVLLPAEKQLLELVDDAYRQSSEPPEQISDNHPPKLLKLHQIAPYLGAICVDPPEPDETRVTLGSRVVLKQDGEPMTVDIVGLDTLYQDDIVDANDAEVIPISVQSPLASSIIGLMTGSIKQLRTNRWLEVQIDSIDQKSVSQDMAKNLAIIKFIK